MLTEKTFDTGELILSYDEGPASGPPMVLLHGLTGERSTWQANLIPALGDSWHIYACDLRGHGKTGRAADADGYCLPDYARDIVALLQHKISEPAVVVGHSLGALTSIAVAASAIDHVRALILLDPPVYARNLSVRETPDYRNWFTWVYETVRPNPSYEAVKARCREMDPAADDATLQAMTERIHAIAPGTVGIVLQDRLMDGLDLAQTLQRITCPTLLLRGEWQLGGTLRDEDVEFVRANLPQAIIRQIPDGTHGFPWEQQELTLEHINAFLKALN